MLRLKLCFLTLLRLTLCFCAVALLLATALCLSPPRTRSMSSVVRLTNTAEQALNLNPSLSDDGRVVVFESAQTFFPRDRVTAFTRCARTLPATRRCLLTWARRGSFHLLCRRTRV